MRNDKPMVSRDDIAHTLKLLRRKVREDQAKSSDPVIGGWYSGSASGAQCAITLLRLDLKYAREDF